MRDQSLPDEFEDVTDAVSDEWESETTPYERVRQVIAHAYSPVSADAVAEDARTSPKTARKHLTALASEGFVETAPGDHGGTIYRRSPESLVLEQATDILKQLSTDELRTRIEELREKLTEYRTEYGVSSPAELTVERTNHLLAGSDTEQSEIDADTLRDWQTTRRNLAFANAALSIANAKQVVNGDSLTDDSDPD